LVCGSALFKEDNFEGYVLKLQDNI
jgi:hypothetical protein